MYNFSDIANYTEEILKPVYVVCKVFTTMLMLKGTGRDGGDDYLDFSTVYVIIGPDVRK